MGAPASSANNGDRSKARAYSKSKATEQSYTAQLQSIVPDVGLERVNLRSAAASRTETCVGLVNLSP